MFLSLKITGCSVAQEKKRGVRLCNSQLKIDGIFSKYSSSGDGAA